MENSILIEEPPREGCTGKEHAELSLDKVGPVIGTHSETKPPQQALAQDCHVTIK